MKTWRPWKPVAKKKQEPKLESAIVKGAREYSSACRMRKQKPKPMVTISKKLAMT